jgi:hypothetical protein
MAEKVVAEDGGGAGRRRKKSRCEVLVESLVDRARQGDMNSLIVVCKLMMKYDNLPEPIHTRQDQQAFFDVASMRAKYGVKDKSLFRKA